MKALNNYIVEKFKISSDIHEETALEKKVKERLNNKEAKDTLKFILNFIKRSKSDKFSNSIFKYWEMYILKDNLICMHSGWSTDGVGHRKIAYVEKVVNNYNKDNNLNIKCGFSGWSKKSEEGVNILNIKEVVDALISKFTEAEYLNDNELISVKV